MESFCRKSGFLQNSGFLVQNCKIFNEQICIYIESYHHIGGWSHISPVPRFVFKITFWMDKMILVTVDITITQSRSKQEEQTKPNTILYDNVDTLDGIPYFLLSPSHLRWLRILQLCKHLPLDIYLWTEYCWVTG